MPRWTGLTAPSLLYTALHQVGAGFEEHERKTEAFHDGLHLGMDRWNEETAGRLRERAATLAGSLGVGADGAAALEAWAHELVEPEVRLRSWEVRFSDDVPTDRTAPLASRARDRLGEWGLDPARPAAESHFVLSGSDRLDVIESLVRDRLGIYRPPHGPMMAGLTSTSFGLANRIGVHGSDDPWPAGAREAHLNFSKGKMRYDDFRERLAAALAAMAGVTPWVASYQRKLGLGPFREFSVRFAVQPDRLDAAVDAFAAADEYLAGVAERSALLVGTRSAAYG